MKGLSTLIVGLMLAAGSVKANAGTANLMLASYHFDPPSCDPGKSLQCAYVKENGYNEVNPGLSLEWEKPNHDWALRNQPSTIYYSAGLIKASFGEWIGFAGMGKKFLKTENYYLCAEIAATINYEYPAMLNLCGVVGNIKLNYLPNPGKGSDAALLSISWDF